MKTVDRPSVAEVLLLLQTSKVAIREMEWIKTPSAVDPPWVQYECACEMLNEVREDLVFRMQYRHHRTFSAGQATVHLPAKFNAALFVGPHRISAIDVDTTPHTNKIGIGRPFHGETLASPHLHIWTEKGYGYAEPYPLTTLELEAVFDAFCPLASITANGTFKHPMKQVDQPLF